MNATLSDANVVGRRAGLPRDDPADDSCLITTAAPSAIAIVDGTAPASSAACNRPRCSAVSRSGRDNHPSGSPSPDRSAPGCPIRVSQRPLEPTHRSGTHAGQENIVVESPRENALDTPFTPKCNGRSGVATGDEDSILLQEMFFEIGQRNGSVLGIAFEEYNVRWLAIASRVCSMEQLDVVRSVAACRGQ